LSKSDFHFSISYIEARQFLSGFLFLFFLNSGLSYSQNFGKSFLAEAGLNATSIRPVLSDTGKYSNENFYFRLRVLHYRKFTFRNQKPKGIFIQLRNSSQIQNHRFIQPTMIRLFQSQTNLSGVLLSGKKNIWISSLGINLIGDTRHPAGSIILPNGSLLFMRRVNPKWSYTVGVGYSFLFGQGLGLPLLGFRYRPDRKKQLSVVLPYSITYRIRHNTRLTSQFQLKPAGGFGIWYSSDYSKENTIKPTFFRRRAFSAGYVGLYPISDRWQLRFGLSLLVRRKIWISDERRGAYQSQENFYAASVKNGLMIEMGIRFTPGKKKKKDSNPDSGNVDEIDLNEDDLKNIDADDLNNLDGIG